MSSHSLEELYVDHDAYFTVRREPGTGRHFIDVLCGGVGVFERRRELTPDEIALFRRDPAGLRVLALQVARWPERFGPRLTPV